MKITNLSRDAIFGHHQSLFIYQRGGENTQTTRQIGPIRLIPPKLKDTNLCTIKPSTFATIRNNFDFLICLSNNFDVSTFGLRIAYDCCKFQGLSVLMKSKRWIKKKEKSQVFCILYLMESKAALKACPLHTKNIVSHAAWHYKPISKANKKHCFAIQNTYLAFACNLQLKNQAPPYFDFAPPHLIQ